MSDELVAPTSLYYFHDPMCSWCYAFRHSLKEIQESLPDHIGIEKIVAGLAKDSHTPMDPNTQLYVQENWRRIEQQVRDTQFNFDFWVKATPMRSTYPACRAVLSAKKQGLLYEDKMIAAIQNGYYQQAKNPSLIETLIELGDSIGLDIEQFKIDIISDSIENQLKEEIHFSRSIGIRSFPSLGLYRQNQYLPISIDYNSSQSVIDIIKQH